MKKFTPNRLMTGILAAALVLSGCSAREETKSGDSSLGSQSSAVSSESTAESSAASSESSSEESTVSYGDDVILGYDKKPVDFSQGRPIDGGVLTEFDFAFMAYAPDVYDDTVKNPSLIDWGTLEFNGYPDAVKMPEYKRVKAGDKLENGLTVKKAAVRLSLDENNEIVQESGEIELDGSITLKGALYCIALNDYGVNEGDLLFFPDAKESAYVPMISDYTANSDELGISKIVYTESDFAVVCAGKSASIGNIADDPSKYRGIISNGEAVRVSLRLENITLKDMYGNTMGIFADAYDIKTIS